MDLSRNNAVKAAAVALSHPLRLDLLSIFATERLVSAEDAAKATGAPLGHLAYHMAKLERLGLLSSKHRDDRGTGYGIYEALPPARQLITALQAIAG